MGSTDYPGDPPGSGFDQFSTPTDPEGTPLSEAGSSDRDHPEWHDDAGAAIEALEHNAALKGHDHSGDGTDVATGDKLDEANTHQNSDVDADATSKHHTLDPTLASPTKAAPALHTHDYNSLPNAPLHKVTSVTRPDTPAVGDMIYQTDNNAFYVWAQYSGSDVANLGLYFTDDFARTLSGSIGTGWTQTYSPIDATVNPSGTAGGVMAIPDGQNVQWVFDYTQYHGSGAKSGFVFPPSGWPWPYVQGRCIARRSDTATKHTTTDDQNFTWQAGPTAMPYNNPWPPTPSSNDVYLRMSDDGQSYCRVCYTYTPGVLFVLWLIILIIEIPLSAPHESVLVYATTTGIAGEILVGKLSHPNFDPFSTYQVELKKNILSFYLDSNYIGQVVDSGGQIATGSSNRGWGIGMTVARAPGWGVTYSHPTLMNQVWMHDVAYYTGSAIWQLLPVGSIPVMRLRQGTRQQLSHAGSLMTWDTVDEDNFGFFNPVSPTDVVIKESGIYSLHCAVQWDSQTLPDVAHVVLLVNGQVTTLRQSQFLRGNTFTPGFSQTLYFAGKYRFAANDLVQIQAFYTSSSNLWNLIYSYSDQPTQIMSRLEINFVSP